LKSFNKVAIAAFNRSVDARVPFDPTVKDGKGTIGLPLPKSNWALPIDTPPFKAYPVTGGITFTYGGVEVSRRGGVMHENGYEIPGLFACGEMVGGVFFDGYPGGSGLTSGVVFGRRAGGGAVERAAEIKG
jgi:tricarballylate dehydrogenase